jgi:hypothetical protein
MSGQPSNVTPLRPHRSVRIRSDQDAPCTVLPMRDRLFERIFEEAWAERERAYWAHREPNRTPRLRLVRP